MKEDENRVRSTEKGTLAPITEASLRLVVTDLLLGRLGDGRFSKGLTLEQSAVKEHIEAAIEAYRSFFYPLVAANEVVSRSRAARRPNGRGTRAQGA